MTSESELREGLRRVAARLDEAAGPTDVTAVIGRRPPASAHPTRALLAVAAVVALLAGVLAVVVLGGDEDESVRVDRLPGVTSTSTSTSEPAGPPTTSEPVDTTSTTEPAAPVPPPSYEGVPWEQLPPRGVAAIEGERVVLADPAGVELGSFSTAEVPDLANTEKRRLLLRPDHVEVVSDIVEEGGCRITGANGARVGACGPEQGELAVIGPDGEAIPLAGTPLPTEGVDASGRWRSGQVSPDGRWVLAQWSGECEVPHAMLVPTDGGQLRTADGFTDWGADGGPWPATSGALGWSADGRAIVHFPDGPACGTGDEQPGTYLIDPDSGERTLAPADRLVGGFPWERVGHVNDRERAIDRALDELGIEQCCGEPSHGGDGASSGVVWDGVEVTIGGGDPGPLTATADDGVLADVTGEEVDGLPVTTATLSGRPLLAFTCGDTRWVLAGSSISLAEPPSLDVVRGVASALIPRLYCTVGEPPPIEQG